MTAVHELGVRDLAAAIRRRERRASDTAEELLARIASADTGLRSFLTVNEGAAAEAAAVDRRLDGGETDLPLAGVPIAVKNNISVRGRPLTCGSRILEGYRPPYDATVVERLRAAGAVILGETNLDEFAMGSSTENSAFGPTRNPWDESRTPGGSSGGSAAAVAARLCPAALGSDTGGSIRQPASFCGVTGLKPTYGRVSRYGLVAFGSSLDQIGPITRTAADAASLLEVIAGHDPRDGTSARESVAAFDDETPAVAGLRIGVPRELLDDSIDERVRGVVREALEALRGAGAELVDIELPHTPYAIPVYYIVATSEASSNLARYDGVGYGRREVRDDIDSMLRATRTRGFGSEPKRRIMLGTFCLSSGYHDDYYDRALRARSLVRQDFERAFERVDVIIGPTAPTPPFKLGEKSGDPLAMYLADVLTVSLNLAGLPGASVPAGFVEENGRTLPVGMQIIAARFREARILRVAAAFESLTTHAARSPEA